MSQSTVDLQLQCDPVCDSDQLESLQSNHVSNLPSSTTHTTSLDTDSIDHSDSDNATASLDQKNRSILQNIASTAHLLTTIEARRR
jgi:hypothetical protein